MDPTDFLSYTPSLSNILEFLPSSDVLRCLRVSKRFNNCLTRDWKKMAKPQMSLVITKVDKDDFELSYTLDDPDISGCCTVQQNCVVFYNTKQTLRVKYLIDQTGAKKASCFDSFWYNTSSTVEGLILVLSALLPGIQMKKFSIKSRYETLHLTTAELESIRESIRKHYSEKSENILLGFECEKYSSIYSDIVHLFDANTFSVRVTDTLTNTFSDLNVGQTKICLYIKNWEIFEMAQILEDWQAGDADITYFNIRETQPMHDIRRKWDTLCSAMQVISISSGGGKEPPHQHFKLRRQSANKVLTVTQDVYGINIGSEENIPF